MRRWSIYTPEGMQDILFEHCYFKRILENDIRQLFIHIGYKEIETPTVEFYDVFSGEQNLSLKKICLSLQILKEGFLS